MSDPATFPVTQQYGPNTAEIGAANGRDSATGRFATGNAGRPKGAKNKATRVIEAVRNGDASDILVAAVRSAVAGNVQAQRLCLERLVPLRRERSVAIAWPALESPAAAAQAATMLIEQVAAGQLTPSEGKRLLELLVTQRRLGEVGELEQRVERLEGAIDGLRQDLAALLECQNLVLNPQP